MNCGFGARLYQVNESAAEPQVQHKVFLILIFLPFFSSSLPIHPLEARESAIGSMDGANLPLKAYKSYLLAKSGRAEQAAFFFDLCLARACEEGKLAPNALGEATIRAKKELEERGGRFTPKLKEDLLTRFTLLFLHEIRLRALAPTLRKVTEEALRRVFDQIYGVDGLRARVRHVLVSFVGTRELLRKKLGREPDEIEIQKEARARIEALAKKLAEGGDFAQLLPFSDDPTTRTLLQDPRFKGQAGEIPGYNFQRFGTRFAEAVRALKQGGVSPPVRSSHGWHLIQLLGLKKTRYEDVREDCKRRFLAAPPDGFEERRIQRKLFDRYKVRLQ